MLINIPPFQLHRFAALFLKVSRGFDALMHDLGGASEQVCAFSSIASLLHLPSSHCILQPLSSLSKTARHRNGIPGSELLERLLVVGIVGINVASEPASRDGESGALDGLLHEERPRGRAGEGSGARARCAADEGGDRHCVWCCGVVVVRGYGAEIGYYSLSCLLGCQLLRCRRLALEAFGLETWHRRGEHVPGPEGQERRRASPTIILFFCFCDGDGRIIISKIL
jgi:hypothetical protein